LSLLACATASLSAAELLDPGAPWPKYAVHELAVPDGVGQGEITVLELVDLDGDHLLDVLAAWRVGDEAVLAAYPGGSREWRIEYGRPLTEPVVLARVPGTIEHATVADMDWDGRLDVLMALEGRSQFDWFPLSSPRPVEVFEIVPLPGPVTALAALDYGRRNFAASPVVGVLTSDGPQLVLFPDQLPPATQMPLLVPSDGAVREIAAGNLDGDAWWDLAVATVRGVMVIAGTDSGSRETAREMSVSRRPVAGDSSALFAIDRFERSTTHRMAVAGSGGIRLFDPQSGERSSALKANVVDGTTAWIRSAWSGVGRGPALVLPDPSGIRLLGALDLGDAGEWRSVEATTLALGGRVAVAETGRMTPDGVDDLVVVLENSNQMVLLVATPRVTYGVTNLDDHDDGTCNADCTLREAINAANASPGYDVISLVPGIPLPLEFFPTTGLPDLSDAVGLNTSSSSWWTIFGSSCVGGCNGLVIEADSCAVEKTHVWNFEKSPTGQRGVGVLVSGSYHPWINSVSATQNQSHGVHFVDSTDSSLTGEFDSNGGDGIHLEPGSTANNHLWSINGYGNVGSGVRIDSVPDTMVGGSDALSSATLDNNSFAAVAISGAGTTGTLIAKLSSSGNVFHSIYIAGSGAVSVGSPLAGAESQFLYSTGSGVSIWTSTASHQITNCRIANNDQDGIAIYGSSNVEIGPDVEVLSNLRHGIKITDDGSSPSHHITIEDSTIGTMEGFNNYGNDWFGVEINGAYSNSIGTAGHGNVIAKNGWGGIRIQGVGAIYNSVKDNFIGTDSVGSFLGNDGAGVVVAGSPNNSIGGAIDAGNVIAWNEGHGVVVADDGAVSVGLRFNSIHDNAGIGIDLGGDGVTPADPNDDDTGPNGLLNQPLVVWAESCGGTTFIAGQRHSAAGLYATDFFTNTTCDGTGWGEGETHLGWFFTVHESSGRYNFEHVVAGDLSGLGITGMTTDFGSSSSEFSNCRLVSMGRAGDATADCVFAADDLAAIINAVDDPSYVTPGNSDADGNGVIEAADLPIVAARAMF